jgi:glycosyltransferase involved in cell wall biosynthesis
VNAEQAVNLVEPTLANEQGHCLSLVRAVCAAGGGLAWRLWVDKGARLPELEAPAVRIEPYFNRRLRKLQLPFLYRRLLARPGSILITTAGRVDLLALALAARGVIPPGKAFAWFHWMTLSPSKRAFFERFARRQPNVVVLGTTPSVERALRECGFAHTAVVPYPATLDTGLVPAAPAAFRHVLFAGAARGDKGFRHVVDLVERLHRCGESIPVWVQASADHYDKVDASVRADLERLHRIGYAPLTIARNTLSAREYVEAFAGGICLQPYDRHAFADRVSGVLLDALSAGCPVVTVAGTWMARAVKRFDAGAVVDEASAQALHEAVLYVRENYARMQENARRGGEALRHETSLAALIERLKRSG